MIMLYNKAAQADDNAVENLAEKMKCKLETKRMQGYMGWQTCSEDELSRLLREHVEKGDPVDVANFCAFLSSRNLSIK